MSKIERLRLRYINIFMKAFIKFHSLRPRGGQEKRRRKLFKNGRESSWDATLNQAVPRLTRMLAYSPIYTTEKTGPGPIKKWSRPIFFVRLHV